MDAQEGPKGGLRLADRQRPAAGKEGNALSGHSKWHNIRLRKEAQDVRKGKIFGKAAREIIVAAREGGGNLEANPRLRDAQIGRAHV